MSILGAFLFFISVLIVGIIPFPIIYGFSNLIRFITEKLFRYRKKIIETNLTGSFPNKSRTEINKIIAYYYKNLTDVLVEGIKAFTMTQKQILKRHKIINPEILEPYFQSGQSIIGVTGHFSNWEWGSLSAGKQVKHNVVAFYKPLKNTYIDRFVRWNRTKFGTTLASIGETSLTFEKFKDAPTIFLMASDQGVPKRYLEKAYWIQFLNRETAFLYGAEKYAKLHNLPVIYIDIQRVKRGYYQVELSVLTNEPQNLEEGKLTQLFAEKLESVIIKKPEDWLWSHKRWKYKRPENIKMIN